MNQDFTSVLAGISTTLPASRYAQEQLQRAVNAGFKWPNADMVIGKIEEELREVREAEAQGDKVHLTEEIGDLLHAIHTLAVFYNMDATEAWQNHIGHAAPIEEKVALVRSLANSQDRASIRHAIGSLLESVHVCAAKYDISWNTALDGTNAKFAHRFSRMEEKLHDEGSTIADTIADKGLKHLVVNYWNTEKTGATR